MIQLFLHLIGDYVTQNDFMALNKKKKTWKGELACQLHCITYSLPFLIFFSWQTVLLVYACHYILDRTNIVGWFLAARNGVWDTENFGFSHDRPFAVAIWLYIITDNIFHLISNYVIISHFH